MPKTPVTKDKRRQKRIIAAAQRQSDKLGIAVDYRFNENGQLLIDGKTSEEIDAKYDETMKKFFAENAEYLDPDFILDDPFEDMPPAPVYTIPPATGPNKYNPHPRIVKFEPKTGK